VVVVRLLVAVWSSHPSSISEDDGWLHNVMQYYLVVLVSCYLQDSYYMLLCEVDCVVAVVDRCCRSHRDESK